jgi:hypothetical protein
LLLFTAAILRLYDLPAVPPGLTHDEADHGLTAWNIVNGEHAIYFTIGYGREPLYDYLTAALMTFTGPTYLANRLTSVYASLLLIAGMYAWVRRAFDWPTALLTATGLSVGFWPLMTGRQALRSTLLPTLFVLAVLFFWQGLSITQGSRRVVNGQRSMVNGQLLISWFLAGVLLGLTFYTYIPARILWVTLPLLVIYRTLARRRFSRSEWVGLGLTLLTAALIAAPLFLYLNRQPDIEVRIQELSLPLTAVANGDWSLLFNNAAASLRLFTIQGDTAWRYNLPGRPFLSTIMGLLFYLGVGLCLWWAVVGLRRSSGDASLITHHSPLSTSNSAAAFFSLTWLVAGFSPVLVTGPELATTQAIGMQPVVYLFPALALVAVYRLLAGVLEQPRWLAWAAPLAAVLLFGATAAFTIRDYFGRWANAPEVRVQYETTMMETLRYLTTKGIGEAAVSTITPGPVHSPAVALLVVPPQTAAGLRWFDARSSLVLPEGTSSIMTIPGFAPVAPELEPYLENVEPVKTLPMRPADLDRPVQVYRLNDSDLADTLRSNFTPPENAPLVFDERVELLGYDLQTPAAAPGETATLVTLWRLQRPLPDAVLFIHMQDAGGKIVAQADSLGAPGESWHSGDLLLQLHQFTVPPDTSAGVYQLASGVYTQPDDQRLPIIGRATGDNTAFLTTLNVVAP